MKVRENSVPRNCTIDNLSFIKPRYGTYVGKVIHIYIYTYRKRNIDIQDFSGANMKEKDSLEELHIFRMTMQK